jgi:hypothetical protein
MICDSNSYRDDRVVDHSRALCCGLVLVVHAEHFLSFLYCGVVGIGNSLGSISCNL